MFTEANASPAARADIEDLFPGMRLRAPAPAVDPVTTYPYAAARFHADGVLDDPRPWQSYVHLARGLYKWLGAHHTEVGALLAAECAISSAVLAA